MMISSSERPKLEVKFNLSFGNHLIMQAANVLLSPSTIGVSLVPAFIVGVSRYSNYSSFSDLTSQDVIFRTILSIFVVLVGYFALLTILGAFLNYLGNKNGNFRTFISEDFIENQLRNNSQIFEWNELDAVRKTTLFIDLLKHKQVVVRYHSSLFMSQKERDDFYITCGRNIDSNRKNIDSQTHSLER
jgi:hypothetical protein